MIVNVALTGAVPGRDDAPSIPLTPDETVADILACAAVGASMFHIHVRDEDGKPTHQAHLYEEIIGRVRDVDPTLVLICTTSGRVDPDPAARMTALELEPALRPDMASLTIGSFNFPRVLSYNPPDTVAALLGRMAEQGVRPELEAFELGMVQMVHVLLERGQIELPGYINLLLGSVGSAPAFVGDLARMVERLPDGVEWGAAGIGVFQRSMILTAAAMGGNVRTGLEDSPRDIDGTPSSNVAAVERAVAAAALAGRAVATPAEARVRLGLPERGGRT